MARASSNYDYEKYGQSFVLMPEGVHDFGVVSAQESYENGRTQWVLELQPIDQSYQTERNLKAWLNEDGCIEALFDAMGLDPRSVDSTTNYYPDGIVNKILKAEVHHVKSKKEGKERTFANIKRLYPAFNMARAGQQRGSQAGAQQAQGGNAPANGFGGNAGAPAQGDSIPW